MGLFRTSSPRSSGAGARVTVRLLALVMLPVTVLCALSGSVVMAHRAAAHRALAVDHGVVELGHLVALRDAIQAERSVVAFTDRFEQLGVTAVEASEFIGFDWIDRVAPARAEAFAAVASLGGASPVSEAALRSLYARIDGPAIGSAARASALAALGEQLEDATTRRVEELEVDADDADLIAALEALRVASGLVAVATPLVVDLSAVWFPGSTDTTAAEERLESAWAARTSGLARLDELDVPKVRASLRRIAEDPLVQEFDDAVVATIAGTAFTAGGAPIDDDVVSAALRGYLVLDALIDDVVSGATSAVHDRAGPLAASEHRSYLRWAGGSVAVAVASIAIALRIARSIAAPLQDLARYAHAVNDGQLDAEVVTRRAHEPRETRMVLDVFADLVTNLQLLDAKANALSHLRFDDPALASPLPGRLGRSLESSVTLLSGSILERDALQTHLAHQATHDSLTGIGNRPAAISGIQAAISRAERGGVASAVLFIDLNQFKAVNDSHGHEVGDEVLRQVAARISTCLRATDLAARLGGDEFVVVAERAGCATDARELAKRLVDAIGQPIDIGDDHVEELHVSIGAAIGIAMTDGPEAPLRLLARADAAMYRAKHHERSAIQVFDADLQHQLAVREDVEVALTAAVRAPDGDGLHLEFQPVVDASSGQIAGVEALVRWERPGHGCLAPDAFIPIAEETSLIIELDRWVLRAAATTLATWSSHRVLAGVPLAVNVSGRHLLSGLLPGDLRAALEEADIEPNRLSIEITETVVLSDLTAAAAELDAVRALGIKVAIDDFGTGYTSLALLQRLPIDTIKIDRTFIAQLDEPRGSSLVRMMTDVGHAHGLDIIAEGVERSTELAALQGMGADLVQGFLVSRPVGPEALSTWALVDVRERRSGADFQLCSA